MNPMGETSQAGNVSRETWHVGDRVKLSAKGRSAMHERLHVCAGTVSGLVADSVTVTWDSVHMNSGSKESLQRNGPHVPRMRGAMSVMPADYLEAE